MMPSSVIYKQVSKSFLKMRERLICPICCDILQNPVRTPCNHIFCNFCILENLKSWQPQCPLCKEKVNKRRLGPIEMLDQITKKFLDVQPSLNFFLNMNKEVINTPEDSDIINNSISDTLNCDIDKNLKNIEKSNLKSKTNEYNNEPILKVSKLIEENQELQNVINTKKKSLNKKETRLTIFDVHISNSSDKDKVSNSTNTNSLSQKDFQQVAKNILPNNGHKLKDAFIKLDKLSEKDVLNLKSLIQSNNLSNDVANKKVVCPIFKFGTLTNLKKTRKKVIYLKKGTLYNKTENQDIIKCPKCKYSFSKMYEHSIDLNSNQTFEPVSNLETTVSCTDLIEKSNNFETTKDEELNFKRLRIKRSSQHINCKENNLNNHADKCLSTKSQDQLLNLSCIEESNQQETKKSPHKTRKNLKRKLSLENQSNEIEENYSKRKKKNNILNNKSIRTQNSNEENSHSKSLATQDIIYPCSVNPPCKTTKSMASRQQRHNLIETSSTCTIYPPTLQPQNNIQLDMQNNANNLNLNSSQEIILNSQLSQTVSESSEILIPLDRKDDNRQNVLINNKINENVSILNIEDLFRNNNSNNNSTQLLLINNEDTSLNNQSSLIKFLLIEMEDVPESINSQEIIEATPPQEIQKKSNIPKPKLMTSGLSENEKEIISKYIATFELSLFSNYDPQVTHLIINNNPTGSTLKFLEALTDGKWVVTMDWVIQSLECGHILPEENFEAINPNGEQGPMRSRLRKTQLFDKFEIYLHGEISFMPKNKLMSILERVGCTVIDDPHKFSPQNIRHGLIVVQEKKNLLEDCQELFRKFKKLVVDHFWPIECISDYKLRPIWSHLQIEETLEYLQLGYPQALMEFDMLYSESENPESAGNV